MRSTKVFILELTDAERAALVAIGLAEVEERWRRSARGSR